MTKDCSGDDGTAGTLIQIIQFINHYTIGKVTGSKTGFSLKKSPAPPTSISFQTLKIDAYVEKSNIQQELHLYWQLQPMLVFLRNFINTKTVTSNHSKGKLTRF